MGDIIVWADIPVTDIKRAMAFYEHVCRQQVVQFPGMEDVAVIGTPGSSDEPRVSADLYVGKPSMEGCTIYLDSGGDIDGMAERVREAGGEIIREKAFMGPMVGWIVVFKDSEGNRIGIQQPGE